MPSLPCHRFTINTLFDRNLVKLIKDFLSFPLLSLSSDHTEVRHFYQATSIAFHPITGHLWLARSSKKQIMVYKINRKDSQCIDMINCPNYVSHICIGKYGLVLIIHDHNSISFFDDGKKSFICLFEGKRLHYLYDIAINDTSQQIAVTTIQGPILLFSFNGTFLRLLTTCRTGKHSICWNEKESILYIMDEFTCSLSIFDTQNDRVINTFRIFSNGEMKNDLRIVSTGYIEHERKLLLACHNKVFVINTKDFSIKETRANFSGAFEPYFICVTFIGSSARAFIFARQLNNIHNQIFVIRRPYSTELAIDMIQV